MTSIQPVNAGRFLRLCRRTLRKASGFPARCFFQTCGEAQPRRNSKLASSDKAEPNRHVAAAKPHAT